MPYPYHHTSAADIKLADVEASMRRSLDECNRLTRTLQVDTNIISIFQSFSCFFLF